MRKTIKLTESELRNLISESVARILEDMDIDPKNKGKFTATQKRTGKSTEELCHSKNPLTRKRANFAKMAKRGWKPLNEAFKSNRLRSWAMAHGGIKKTEADIGYPNSNVHQDALSDVRDNDITYFEEFSDYNDALGKRRMLMSEQIPYGRRSKYDMSSYFTIYRANDGTCVLVGIDRNSIETSHTWGGEVSKKAADRFWRNEHLPYPTWSINRYPDETDKYYYYSKKGRDFGLKTNKNFHGKMRDNQKIRNMMTDEQWKEYQDKRVKDMDNYLTKYYGKGLSKQKMYKYMNYLTEIIDKNINIVYVNKLINNYLGNICKANTNNSSGDARTALMRGCYKFIVEESYNYEDYAFFLKKVFNTQSRMKNAFIKYIYENQQAIEDDALIKYKTIDNLIKYIRKYKYSIEYFIEKCIKEEYLDDMIWKMLQNADFFNMIKYDKQGMVYANRMINIPKDQCEEYFEFYDSLGEYWSYTKGFAYDNFFGEDFKNGNIYQIVFYARVPIESISMYEMMKANFGNFDTEDEVTLISGKPVEIYKVTVTDLSNHETWKVPLKSRYICKA